MWMWPQTSHHIESDCRCLSMLIQVVRHVGGSEDQVSRLMFLTQLATNPWNVQPSASARLTHPQYCSGEKENPILVRTTRKKCDAGKKNHRSFTMTEIHCNLFKQRLTKVVPLLRLLTRWLFLHVRTFFSSEENHWRHLWCVSDVRKQNS